MFYHPAFFPTVLNVCIVIAIIAVGYITSNPLVIMGLFMLQQTPIVSAGVPQEEYAEQEESEQEVEAEYNESNVGYLAKFRAPTEEKIAA